MEDSSSQLETRVTRLETHMEHMGSNISRIIGDLHDLRTSTEARFDRMNDRISMLHVTINEKFGEVHAKFGEIKVWALTVLGGGFGFGILNLVGRVLHWF